jgi:hypothetical protein
MEDNFGDSHEAISLHKQNGLTEDTVAAADNNNEIGS